MKIAIIQFPGSNCESESMRAIKQAGMEPVEFLWNQNYDELKNFDGFFIVGGFSYEDRSRSGIISALDPLMKYIKIEAEKGKPVLGVCNGAQILVESGMAPGLKNYELGMALAVNKREKNGKILGTGFYNAWANVQSACPAGTSAFNKRLQFGEFINIPVAHGEGRFVIPEGLLAEMQANNQTVFRYCLPRGSETTLRGDGQGKISEEFPINPNGSIYNLAAVCNPNGNVMAMMPHPERSENGQPIFTSMRDYIIEAKTINAAPLSYTPAPVKIKKYAPEPNSFEFLIELIITDNEANTVQSALAESQIHANIKRYTHWQINTSAGADNVEIKKAIVNSGELFNSNKEKEVDLPVLTDNTLTFLIKYKDDFVGQSKRATLKKRFNLNNITNIEKAIVWQITTIDGNTDDIIKKILDSQILFNQFSQDCYEL